MSYLSDWSDVIAKQGQQMRDREAADEALAVQQLPDAIASVATTSTADLLTLWMQSTQRSQHYLSRKRHRAVYRLHAYHCRQEILRRTGDKA